MQRFQLGSNQIEDHTISIVYLSSKCRCSTSSGSGRSGGSPDRWSDLPYRRRPAARRRAQPPTDAPAPTRAHHHPPPTRGSITTTTPRGAAPPSVTSDPAGDHVTAGRTDLGAGALVGDTRDPSTLLSSPRTDRRGCGTPHPPDAQSRPRVGEHGESTLEVCCGSIAQRLTLPRAGGHQREPLDTHGRHRLCGAHPGHGEGLGVRATQQAPRR